MATISGPKISPGLTSAPDVVDVTPSDTDIYDPPLRGFRVFTTAGDVYVKTLAGNTRKIGNVQIGEFIAVGCTQILSTLTTAAGVTGYW